jgi:hypothetical protein
VSLIVNNEEYLLKVLSDTGASNSIILEAYTSEPLIKKDGSNTTTWSTMDGKFTGTKTGHTCDIFTPRVQSQEKNVYFLAFHVDDFSESSRAYDMILGNQPVFSRRIRHNHELQ